jgi:hypothetical protein
VRLDFWCHRFVLCTGVGLRSTACCFGRLLRVLLSAVVWLINLRPGYILELSDQKTQDFLVLIVLTW